MTPADRSVPRGGGIGPAHPGMRRLLTLATRRPGVGTPVMTATTTGALFVAGGCLVLLSAIGRRAADHPVALGAVGVSAVLVGVLTLRGRQRFPRPAYHAVVLTGSAMTAAGIWLGGPGAVPDLAPLYVFVAIALFGVCWLAMAGQLGVALTGAFLALGTSGAAVGDRVILAGVVVSVAVVIGWLARRADVGETDPLTGLANRRGLERLLTAEVDRARHSRRPVSLAVLAVDRFAEVNTAFGRAAGDDLLTAVTRRWRDRLAAEGLAAPARTGGDEFTVVLPIDADRAERIVERLRTDVQGVRTCSAGLASLEPGDSVSLLLSRAEAALYQAKQGGRDRLRRGGEQHERERLLRDALDHDQLFLVYQPVVALPVGRTVGREALVRLRHPDRGVLAPGDFLPDAADSRVIHDLGEWVTREALAAAAGWHAVRRPADGPVPRVAINVAGPELRRRGYARRTVQWIAEAGLPRGGVVLEVTETTLDADSPEVVAALDELRCAGVHIALDDFGTGWSTLSRLDRLPIDILKVDRSFVTRLGEPGADPALLHAIVAMGAALGTDVVAEGVETPQQAAVVTAAGCGFAQGYLYGRGEELPRGTRPA